MHILQEDTNHLNSEHSGSGNQFINFSEPYHKIAGEENYKNSELNEIIAHSIYDNIKNNINYIKETQYNSDQDISPNNPDSSHFVKNKEERHNCECLDNNISLRNNIKFTNSKADSHNETHNILKNDINNLEIHQCIPYISSTEFLEQNKKNKEINNLYQTHKTMNDPRYNDYPPMNGFGYNHNNTSNQNGFYTNTYNKELPNLAMQQHNMHGRNNLMFEDGNIPYGLYDQSNYTGINSVMCGNGVSNDPKMMYRRNEMNSPPYYQNYPMNNGMGYNEPIMPSMQYNPNMRKNMMRNAYSHECNYMNNRSNYPAPKNNMDNTSEKSYKKDNCRKNISKIKKGDIDINIETSSSSKKGVIIDLNIGVGN